MTTSGLFYVRFSSSVASSPFSSISVIGMLNAFSVTEVVGDPNVCSKCKYN